MQSSEGSALRSFLLVGGLLVLLGVVAVLQYRWIGELSEAERTRMKVRIEERADRFSEDFDREVSRAFFAFLPAATGEEGEPDAALAAALKRFRATAPEPRLVTGVYRVRSRGNSSLALEKLDEASGAFHPLAVPPELAPLHEFLLDRRPRIIVEAIPGLLVWGVPSSAHVAPDPLARDFVLLTLDKKVLVGTLLPRIASARFPVEASGGYGIAVLDGADASVFSERRDALASPDVARPLFSVRRFPELVPAPKGQAPARDEATGRFQGGGGRWRLLVNHPAGSLQAAVTSARRRNLAVGSCVLALLGAAAVLTAAAGERARRLARQQVSFVAAVSHELRTPLTAIRSAGQNLADGVVAEPEQVKRYGALVEREGRRLTDMVTRVLDFSRIESGQATYHLVPTAPAEVVDEALASLRPALDERRIAVERRVDDGLPRVSADPDALRRAVQNLLDNALKYGGSAGWVGVDVTSEGGNASREVVVTVADRGKGIRKADVPRIFEPFYRSPEASAGGATGSGLGLALVKHVVDAHGGRLSVRTGPEGTAFTIHLPVAGGAA